MVEGAVLGASLTGVVVCWLGFILLMIGLLSPPLLPVMKNDDKMHKTAIAAAKIHVPFSSTSVVCFTPINCVLMPAIVPESPPPFGFCTRMIKPRIIAAIKIRIRNKMVIAYAFKFSILAAK